MSTRQKEFLNLKAFFWANWFAFGNLLLLMGGDDSVDIRLHLPLASHHDQKNCLQLNEHNRS